MSQYRRRTVILAGIVLTSGCSEVLESTPTQTQKPGTDVTVEVSSEDDEPNVITVGAAPPGHRGLEVEREDGTVDQYPDADGIEDLPPGVVPRVVSLRPYGDETQYQVYRWSGPDSDTVTFEHVPDDAVVFYTVSRPTVDRPLKSMGRLTCGEDGDITGVTVQVNADGSVVATNDCADN